MAAESGDRPAESEIADRFVPPAAVGRVPDNRMANMRQVDADLMGSARLDLDVQQAELGIASCKLVECEGGTPIPTTGEHRHPSPVPQVAAKRSVDLPAGSGLAVHQGDVTFQNLAVPKLIR